jgi:VWFA-related protein
MTPFALLLLPLLAQAAQAGSGAAVRSLNVAITDEKGAAVEGLLATDLAVLEDGVAREVTRVERDRRPLTLVLLLDSSAAVGTAWRLNVIEAVEEFVRRLPEGSQLSIWTTGDRPTRRLDFGEKVDSLRKLLGRVVPDGGNTLLDAIVEAGGELKKQEGGRSAMVIVTSTGVEFSSRDRHLVIEQARGLAQQFAAVLFESDTGAGPDSSGGLEARLSYEQVLGTLTRETGGVYETPLSSLAVGRSLGRISADLAGQYRLSYATLAEAKPKKIEVKVARPGVRVRATAPEKEREP